MTFRPFVTFPNGVHVIYTDDVQTDAERQAVINHAGGISQKLAGVQDADIPKLSPQRIREMSAKVEFFRVNNWRDS